MAHFDGEYELRFFYDVTLVGLTLGHKHTFDIAVLGTPAPGAVFSDIEVGRRDGGSYMLDEWVDDMYVPVFLDFYGDECDLVRAELWYAEEATTDFTFIAAHAIGLTGTAEASCVTAYQATMTYRSAQGGVGRIQLMETVLNSNAISSFPTAVSIANALMAVVVGADTPVLARDNSYPVVANRLGSGQNEALFRKRYRI